MKIDNTGIRLMAMETGIPQDHLHSVAYFFKDRIPTDDEVNTLFPNGISYVSGEQFDNLKMIQEEDQERAERFESQLQNAERFNDITLNGIRDLMFQVEQNDISNVQIFKILEELEKAAMSCGRYVSTL